MNMIVGSMLGNPLGGGLDKLTGDGDAEGGEKTETGEDPEVVQARIEAEERRKEKHRKMENEREKMRQDIRDKVGGVVFTCTKPEVMLTNCSLIHLVVCLWEKSELGSIWWVLKLFACANRNQ
uniref:Complexin 2 n=1 Tax=Plectus sambesii TaxID=2011161 RepID=A0A914XIS8_9BILA